jgi:uncharacterized membrane protein YgcG
VNRIRVAWVALVAGFACAGLARADERILSFDSVVTVARDGTLEVRESIRVRVEGDAIKRGIIRDFPTTYPAADGRQIVVGFAFEGAARDGVAEKWRVEPHGNGVRIYLGSASVMLEHGEHVYDLVYRTERQMGYFADHDELYWNATGNGWMFPIDHASARVILPADIPPGDVRMEAYTGPQGAQGHDYTATLDGAVPTYVTTRGLGREEGLTIVAMWPKGHISAAVENPLPPAPMASADYDEERDGAQSSAHQYDSPAEAFLHRDLPHDRRPLYFAGFGFFALLAYYYLVWHRIGRDPPAKVTIPLYESPPGQSPASMRYLMQMGFDDKCFAAGVLSLAVKGYLRIEQGSGALGTGKTYTLHKVDPPVGAPPRSEDELALFAELFASGQSIELVDDNYRDIRDARAAQERALKAQFKSRFFHINGGWHAFGIFLGIVVFAVTMTQPGETEWPFWFFVTGAGLFSLLFIVAIFIMNGVFGRLLKAPTVAGQAVMDRIRGFKMYLDVAEGEDLKRIQGPPLTPRLFEACLPAALALGVEQKWAERFAEVFRVQAPNYQPAWYIGGGWNAANVGAFSSNFSASFGSAISSSSTAPGSSSGGGGGGSSGGGGGGGGGGGW